jgi:hypothetical protein
LNEKAQQYVELLAHELEAKILMALDVQVPGQIMLVLHPYGTSG